MKATGRLDTANGAGRTDRTRRADQPHGADRTGRADRTHPTAPADPAARTDPASPAAPAARAEPAPRAARTRKTRPAPSTRAGRPPGTARRERGRTALTALAVGTAALSLTALSQPTVAEPGGVAQTLDPAEAGAAPDRAPAETACTSAGTLRGTGGRYAFVSLCAGTGGPSLALSAPASCRQAQKRFTSCITSGSWTARRNGTTVASGTLPGSTDYPGPGTYDITATVRVRSTPPAVDITHEVSGRLTFTRPAAPVTHRIEVDRNTLRAGTTSTLSYTVYRDSEEGDGSARLGVIGEEDSGIRLTTTDPRCVNPLVGRHPSKRRNMFALDCALTDLQPGHPSKILVRAALPRNCSTIVSKAGYWMPRGQTFRTGGMIAGPSVKCAQ